MEVIVVVRIEWVPGGQLYSYQAQGPHSMAPLEGRCDMASGARSRWSAQYMVLQVKVNSLHSQSLLVSKHYIVKLEVRNSPGRQAGDIGGP